MKQTQQNVAWQENGSRSYLISIVMVAVLGGLLFGYDTAVISGAEKGLQAFFKGAADFQYSDFMHGFTSSSALIGCIFGSAVSGFFASRFGRKRSLIFAGICFFLSAWGSMEPESYIMPQGRASLELLYVFNAYRVLGGFGVGMASAICPMYIGEVAPSNIRGMLVSWNQFAIIFGQLVVYFVNFIILGSHANPIYDAVGKIANWADCQWTVETGWRYMFGSECVPAALFTLLICFVPETPRYLVMIGQDKKAEGILARINGSNKAKEIIRDIKETITVRTEPLMTYGFLCIFVGVMLSVFQQAVGINAVLYYAPRIYEDMGMKDPMVQTVIMGIVNARCSVHGRETRTQASAHLGFYRHGNRCARRGTHLRQPESWHGDDAEHHGIQCELHVLVGPYRLGSHRRALPKHHPWCSGCHCSSLPVDIQFHREFHLRTAIQHASHRRRRLRTLVHLCDVWRHLCACRTIRLETGS